ncbi:MAG TPA: hypothetical protein PLB36_03955 [Bacillota bacterium]|nr:hypothetical protein [Bacillota bacterium]HOL12028.1 hypothetical protein [Bacillota bacterium]HPP60853.1 hypothetical protein [Bacillota bacterium]HPT62378.1 hypothetical protein [Bacillota bacterium]
MAVGQMIFCVYSIAGGFSKEQSLSKTSEIEAAFGKETKIDVKPGSQALSIQEILRREPAG